MKLRSLTLSNVRKFAGQTATISGIGEGVSVISEANEFGKSTFFDALHALFFLKYGTATREVKSLQPRAGGPVRISALIELPAGAFTVEKSFLAQKRAAVRDAAGNLVALDDEAEQWIAQLMGTGMEGPAGLLWVRQGITALEPAGNTGADKTEKERLMGARRDLLSSVAGEIDMVTGGRRMDRVIEAATQALGRLATATGQPKANGPWKEAETEAQTHAARHDELDRLCSELSAALAQRREIATRLAVLEAPGAQDALVHAQEQAQAAHDAAQAHADKLTQAQSEAALRGLELESAQAKHDGLIAAAQAFEAAKGQSDTARIARDQSATEAVAADAATDAAHTALTDATTALTAAMAAKEAAQHSSLRKSAGDHYEQLRVRLEQVSQKRATLEAAQAELAAQSVTRQALEAIEQAQAEVSRLQADAAKGGVEMTLAYDAQTRVAAQGAPLEAGAHTVAERQVFDLPGIGKMTLDPGAAAVDMKAVKDAQHRLQAALAGVGMASVQEARVAAGVRTDKAGEVALLKSVLETLAPEGVEKMQAAVAQALAAFEAMADGGQQEQVDPAALAAQLTAAQTAERDARLVYDQCRDRRDTARAGKAHAQATFDAAEQTFSAAATRFGDAGSFAERKAEAARAQSLAQVAAADAQSAVDALRKAAPDLATAQADLSRAQSAARNAQDEISRLRMRTADLSATIRARAEDGIEEKRDEVAGLMQRAGERAARFAHEAAGLTVLLDALRAKRGAAQEAYFGPVQQELAPLLALLHADAALSFDPASMLPQGLARGGADEPLEMLSGGTQEQIAILTRLAFARLFAKQGKPMPIILDDALVYSDDSRITAMFTALHRVAADQQVIVFTCRQMAFAGLGGVRPMVDVTTDV